MPRRRLSPEERELWRKVAASATPLKPDAPEAEAERPSEPAIPVGLGDAPARPIRFGRRPAAPRTEPRVTLDLVPDPHARLDRAHPHMDRRRFEKMRRGRLDPEARIDLHGMTAERAHGALTDFVLDAHAQGLRLVLVITGKGRDGEGDALAPHRRGVLRHSVPHWLAAPPLSSRVLQIAPAHVKHGGGGAYYVYLRRTRPQI